MHAPLKSQFDQTQATITRLQKLVETGNSAQSEGTKTLVDELQRKTSQIMIKDSEIEGLKKILKELRETIDQNDTSRELQDLKKQNQFLGKERDMKDLMFVQVN